MCSANQLIQSKSGIRCRQTDIQEQLQMYLSSVWGSFKSFLLLPASAAATAAAAAAAVAPRAEKGGNVQSKQSHAGASGR